MLVKSARIIPSNSCWAMLFTAAVLATASMAAGSYGNAANLSFTEIDMPGATATFPYGINDAEQIVGYFATSEAHQPRLSLQRRQLHPNRRAGRLGTLAYGINDAGQIVGYFSKARYHGFLYSGGSFTQIDVPGANATLPPALTTRDRSSGNFDNSTGVPRLSLHRRQLHRNRHAGRVFATYAYGINDAGQIVGYFRTARAATASSTAAAASPKSTCRAQSIRGPTASTTRGRSSGIFLPPGVAVTASSTAAAASPKSTCPAPGIRLPMASTTRGRSSGYFDDQHG